MHLLKIERQKHLDYLRVFAIFAVMIIHISAQNWDTIDVNDIKWQIFNFYDGIVRWGVPIFVMISGALFLPKNIPIKTIYSKYVLRMITAFITWSTIYSAVFTLRAGRGRKLFLLNAISGHYHMWFIPMIIGIYISIPFIKKIIIDKTILKYFLLLSFIFSCLIPQILMLTNDFAPTIINEIIQSLNENVSCMNLHIVVGYPFYFILGYYLNSISLNKKQRYCIYILGIIGSALTVILNSIVALKTQTYYANYYGYFTINVMLESIAIFTLFKYLHFKNEHINNFIVVLSKYSFGAYLVHVLIIKILNWLGLNTLSFNPIFSVPIIGIIVFTLSFMASAICNKIPKLNKYIV